MSLPKTREPAEETQESSALSPPAGRSSLFYAVAALAVVYCAFLIGLAFFTSNPVVLNPHQIRRSSLIVSGSPASFGKGGVTVTIEKIWKGQADGESVFVRELFSAQLQEHELWILPLQRVSPDEYVVTPLKNASPAMAVKFIYPADPATLNKLKSLLSSGAPAP